MGLSKEALASLNAMVLGKKKPQTETVPVRRKPTVAPVVEKPVTLARWPVMFADDELCPEWPELVAWARQAPTEAFEILPCRAPDKHAKGLRHTNKASLRKAILAELDEEGYAVVVGLIYELRTLKTRWEERGQ
jgi:hypothetical protein